MAKVTVSVPQDEIVRGTFCEGTVLPLSSLTMRDGNTGVYMIDYVEGVFGQEMVARFVPVTVEEQDRRTFPLGICWIREYVVSSNRPLKDGEEVAAHETVASVRGVLPFGGGLTQFGNAPAGGGGVLFAGRNFLCGPKRSRGQPVAEDALDSPWIASYVREGERITFLLFSSQVATAGEGEQLAVSLLGPGAGELVLSTGDVAAMLRQLKTVFWLVLIPCLLAIAYGLTVKVIPPWWQRSSLKTKVAAAVPLGAVSGAVCRIHLGVAVPANPRHFSAHRAFLRPAVLCLPNPLGFEDAALDCLKGVNLGKPAWGDIPAGERLELGLGLLAAALLAAVIAGVLLIQALRKRVYKTVGKD